MQSFISAQYKFDANNLSLPRTYRGVPLCKTGEEKAMVVIRIGSWTSWAFLAIQNGLASRPKSVH
jgi:hypothetical protein